jgi:phosphomethylpyrimidine synthase
MCGPNFCAMKITHEVRDWADKNQVAADKAVEQGLAARAEAFRKQGGEIYGKKTEGG